MTKQRMYVIPLLTLGSGLLIGTIVGYKYAENRIERDFMGLLHQDTAITLRSYQRIRRLIESNEPDKLARYLDTMIHTQESTLKATDPSPSLDNSGKQ